MDSRSHLNEHDSENSFSLDCMFFLDNATEPSVLFRCPPGGRLCCGLITSSRSLPEILHSADMPRVDRKYVTIVIIHRADSNDDISFQFSQLLDVEYSLHFVHIWDGK